MKKGKDTPAEKADGKSKSRDKMTKPAKSRKQPNDIRLPFLVEFTYTLSIIILILLALSIMVTSFLAGASLFTVVLRTGVAVTVVGSLLMLITSQISSGLLFSVKIEQEEEKRKQEEEAAIKMMDSESLNQAEA